LQHLRLLKISRGSDEKCAVKPRILAIEDAPDIQLLIRGALGASYDVVISETIEQARGALANNPFDLILLDLGLPDGDGMRFFAELKATGKLANLPVFIVTGSNSIQEKTIGFQLGIEDYIVKPFDPLEMKLRVEARIKKGIDNAQSANSISIGNLNIDLASHHIRIQLENETRTVELSSKEFGILTFLARVPNKIKSREQIIEAVWGNGIHLSDRTIDSHVSRLRKKLLGTNVRLEAVTQVGYRIALS